MICTEYEALFYLIGTLFTHTQTHTKAELSCPMGAAWGLSKDSSTCVTGGAQNQTTEPTTVRLLLRKKRVALSDSVIQ